MAPDALETIARITAREQILIGASRGGGMQATPDKIAALADVTSALERAGDLHALVGGVAVGVRSGVPRATLDVGVAVRSTVGRDHVRAILIEAGFALTGEFAHSLNFRHRSGEPVQVFLAGEFDPMIDRAEALDLAGLQLRVVTTADLITMKERAAADPARRPSKALRHRADIALLRGDVPGPGEGW